MQSAALELRTFEVLSWSRSANVYCTHDAESTTWQVDYCARNDTACSSSRNRGIPEGPKVLCACAVIRKMSVLVDGERAWETMMIRYNSKQAMEFRLSQHLTQWDYEKSCYEAFMLTVRCACAYHQNHMDLTYRLRRIREAIRYSATRPKNHRPRQRRYSSVRLM